MAFTPADLHRLTHYAHVLATVLPCTSIDVQSPDHPWVDVYGADGDQILQVGENLADAVTALDLADAVVASMDALPRLLAEVQRLQALLRRGLTLSQKAMEDGTGHALVSSLAWQKEAMAALLPR